MKIPKLILAIAIATVIAVASLLYYLISVTSQAIPANITYYAIFGIVALVAVPIVWSLVSKLRSTAAVTTPINWVWIKSSAWLVIKLLLFLAIFLYGYKNWTTVKDTASSVASSASSFFYQKQRPAQPQGWVFSWKSAKGDNARDLNKTGGSYRVTITTHTEDRLCFILHYVDKGRQRVAEFFGERTADRRQKIYKGTWSQGRKGDGDHDGGTWKLKEYNSAHFGGEVVDHRGFEFDSVLELR